MKTTESAGGVVLNIHGEVLVVNQTEGNSWSLPKGHIEEGEDTEEAARREIREESGVKNLVLIESLGSYSRFKIAKDGIGEDKRERKTLHFFLFRTDEMELAPEDPHHPEARWLAFVDAIKILTHPADRKFLEDVKSVCEKAGARC